MPNDPLPLALSFIKTAQNFDGGWGYWQGRKSLVEPTSFCLLALSAERDNNIAVKGLTFIKACQLPSGAVGINPKDAEGSWMSYAALLAFQALGAAEEKKRLIDWVLKMEDASGRFSPADLSVIARLYRYTASIQGWPWTPGTTAWVEPTSLFITALIRVGIPPDHKRIRSGVSLLLDRKIRSGGWNFGNPFDKSYELEAGVLSTSLTLTALSASGFTEDHPAVISAIGFLDQKLNSDISTASLAWTLIACRNYSIGSSIATCVAKNLGEKQEVDGSWRGNLFETALAYLALCNPQALIKSSRRAG